MIIIGAGMAGCIAAIMNPKAIVLEANKNPPTNHNAVLRFREDVVSQITGIPFKKVTVRKTIWDNGEKSPTPRLANLYSQKVSGKILNRSIWNLETSERYVAPQDFHMQMLDMIKSKIRYGAKVKGIDENKVVVEDDVWIDKKAIISTIPIHVMNNLMYVDDNRPYGLLSDKRGEFQPISTMRGKVPNSEVHQTIYYPDPNMSLYRATLTGEDLIVEFMIDYKARNITHELNTVLDSFGLLNCNVGKIFDFDRNKSVTSQQYGKITPINEKQRRNLIYKLSAEHGIYSLGRFGTWRNILLDDVVSDVNKIKKLIQSDLYDARLNH